MAQARGARQIRKSKVSEAEAQLIEHGYDPQSPRWTKGVPEGYKRFTCVLDVADRQLMHDWSNTVRNETLTSIMAVAIREYIESHIKKAAEDGLKVKRPSRDSEDLRIALERYADLYEQEGESDPYARYL